MVVSPVGHGGCISIVVDVSQVVPDTVTPCSYGGGMDISSGVNGSAASPEGFVSVVASTVGGLVWGSMPVGERQAWLSALTTAEGAIAASRAGGVACGAGRVGAGRVPGGWLRPSWPEGCSTSADVLVELGAF